MSEIIENMARSMWEVIYPDPSADELDLIWPTDKDVYVKEAQAALAVITGALRAPSEEMLIAAQTFTGLGALKRLADLLEGKE